MIYLLDVNLLIALAWPSHIQHEQAHLWFHDNTTQGWATCPMTQCAFIRISSNPKIINNAVSPREALSVLEEITTVQHHVFWPDSIQATRKSVFPSQFLVGHRQVTDAYLLGLAIHNQGGLATFDQKIKALLPAKSPHNNSLCVLQPKS